MTKKKFLRIFAFSAVVLGGVSSVHATEASLGAMFNDLCHGRPVTVFRETFQGYLESYPPLEGLMLAQGEMSAALAFCDELQIISNFTLNTLTFDLYLNEEVVVSHVLQDETQENLEAHRELAREYLGTAVDPQVQQVEPVCVVAPVYIGVPAHLGNPMGLAPRELERDYAYSQIQLLESQPPSRFNSQKIDLLRKLL